MLAQTQHEHGKVEKCQPPAEMPPAPYIFKWTLFLVLQQKLVPQVASTIYIILLSLQNIAKTEKATNLYVSPATTDFSSSF